MAWITLTASDVKSRMSGAEYDAITAASLASGQVAAAVVASQLSAVIRLVRGHVAGCNRNQLGAEGTIPDELEDATLALLRQRIFTRLPGLQTLLDEGRRTEYSDAIQLLRDVAACRFAIVPPATPAADQAGGPGVELVNSETRIASRDNTSGLL